MNTVKGVVLVLFAALGLPAEAICGLNQRGAGNVELMQVSCIDFARLRAVAPEFPWPLGTRTQVLIHVREGDAVRVTVDGVAKFADLFTNAYGRRVALVEFDGIEHSAVSVKVYRAAEE